MSSGPRKHPLLDNVKARFQQQHEEQQERVERLQAKREAEIFHNRYLKQYVVDPTKMAEAKFAAEQWAKKHSTAVEKQIKKAIRENRDTPVQRRRKMLLDRARNDGFTQQQSPVQRDRLVRGSASTSTGTGSTRLLGTQSERPSSTQTRRPGTRVITESECIDVDSFDETISLGNCIREYNKQSRDNEGELKVMGNHNTDGKLTHQNNEIKKQNRTKQDSISFQEKEEILIEDDDLSVILLDNSDVAATPDCTTSDHLTPDPVTSVTDNLSGTRCCVVNCGADFSTKRGILDHESEFDHSPCNPLLQCTDCRLPPSPLGYACPKCMQVFQTEEDCIIHQKSDHLPFLPPLEIACYLCPQCLSLFPSRHDCKHHISQLNHYGIAYPFNGDTRNQTSTSPVPVSRPLAEDFVTRCRFVSFSVSCLDCTLVIESNAEIVQHLEETNNQHWHFISTATTQQVDVFSKYLASHACSTCESVIPAPVSEDDIHHCVSNETESVIGQIAELNCQTFRDFVRRCCISFMVSQDAKPINRFSDQKPPSSLRQTTNRKRKRSCDSVCLKEIKVEACSSADTVYDSIKDRLKISVKKEQDIPVKLEQNSSEDIKYVKHECLPKERSQNLDKDCLDQSNLSDVSLIDPVNLNKMKNIIFVNLEVWPYFFKKLPLNLPSNTFVWGFCGEGTWQEPHSCPVYDHQNGNFYLSPPCGHSKDAADFSLCLTFGRMDECLDKRVNFTILSGDHSYQQLDRQKGKNNRTVVLIDPSNIHQWTDYNILYTIISSVGDQ
ncbi:E3 SUMO-protein ligase ZNF451-like isoform X2 [Argopecten irradians]|uniref:E3 SUMO-protein ligase ZNF451-like isoform X2 n=1 Tax=Argopecten irradians TaxID=31199 RepID=UPI00372108C5